MDDVRGVNFVKEFLVDKMGVDVSYADFRDVENVMQNIRSNTAVLYTETPSNPSLGLVNIQAISRIAKENDCLFIVDSTFAPPPIQRPLELGADLVIHSLTKYINGHGDTLGGAIIGPKSIIENIHFPGMPCFTGACLSPFNAWLIMRGMMTLDMRIQRHCENALAVAEFLNAHPRVSYVHYPALPGDKYHQRALRYLPNGAGAVLSFGVQGGVEEGRRFINGLKLFSLLANVADAKSLVIHPASTTHGQMNERELLAAGVRPELIRLSVGLEDKRDLLDDLAQALDF